MIQVILVTVGECIVYLVSIICIGAAINGNYKLYAISNSMSIQKRKPSIVFGTNASLIILMIAFTTVCVAKIHTKTTSAFSFISDTLALISGYMYMFFCITKQWMIFYKQKWTFYTLQTKWQNVIADLDNNNNQNWFITNNNKYGSLSYMYRVFAIYHIFGILLGVMGSVTYNLNIFDNYVTALATVPFLFSVIFLSIIIYKTPKYEEIDDIFFISWETKIHSRLLSILLLIFISHQIAFGLINIQISSIIFYPMYILNIYAIHHVSTYLIYSKHYHMIEDDMSLLIPSSPTNSSMTLKRKSYIDGNKQTISLKQILSTNESINLFMIHLSHEYSMEILLSLIEIQKYQEYVINSCQDMNIDINKYNAIMLPSDIPITSIMKSDDSLKTKAYKIFTKYIEERSEYAVNICYDDRKLLFNMLHDLDFLETNNNITIQDIFDGFEKVKKEMMTLLYYSFVRFKETPQYQKTILLLRP
eukprot:172433_1